MPQSAIELEALLAGTSHNQEAIDAVRAFAQNLANTQERLKVWGAPGVLVQSAILASETAALGFDSEADQFTLLQGDIVKTAASYLYGTRIETARFLVLNSSCDLVPGRQEHSILLPIETLERTSLSVKLDMGDLLKFRRNNAMFLPVLKGDNAGVVGNAVRFGPLYQIKSGDLLLAQREASLTILGWRILASCARMVIARSNPREVDMRRSIQETRAAVSQK